MGKLHRLPRAEQTEREASDWFARLGADDVTRRSRTFRAVAGCVTYHAKVLMNCPPPGRR